MADNKGAKQVSRQQPSPGLHTSEVLHQKGKPPVSPVKAVLGGVAVIVTIGYFTLFSHKKPEATALDVAKVTTGTSSPDNTRPRK